MNVDDQTGGQTVESAVPDPPEADSSPTCDEHEAQAPADTETSQSTSDEGGRQWQEALEKALVATVDRLASLEDSVAALEEKVAFVPPQIRMLAGKVEGLATSVAEPRCRALLSDFIRIYDLVEQMLRMTSGEAAAGSDHERNYKVLLSQIRQMLEANGLSEIDSNGKFDPELHRVIKQVTCEDAQQDAQIVEVIRTGFRTKQAVLRFSEVVVAHRPESDSHSASDVASGSDSDLDANSNV